MTDAISLARHVAATYRPLSDNPYDVGTVDYHRFRLMWLWYRSFLNVREVERLLELDLVADHVNAVMKTTEFKVPT